MRKTSLLLAALLAVAGICVMLWPVVTGNRLQSSAATAVQEFLADRDEPEQQYPELLAALQAYNRQLYAEKQGQYTEKHSQRQKLLHAEICPVRSGHLR